MLLSLQQLKRLCNLLSTLNLIMEKKMNIITFSATKNQNHLDGVLIERSNSSTISFDSKLSHFKDATIKETNIKDYPNFIASFIKRLDKNEDFDTVTVVVNQDPPVTVPILRDGIAPSKETVEVFIIGDIKNQNIIKNQSITFDGLSGNNISIDVSSFTGDDFIKRVVPANFVYTRDPLLNTLLAYNVMPFDYDRSLNTVILLAVKNIKSKKMKEYLDQEFAYINKFNQFSFRASKGDLFIIPLKLL